MSLHKTSFIALSVATFTFALISHWVNLRSTNLRTWMLFTGAAFSYA